MKGFYKKLCETSTNWCHMYPNVGLPNAMGGYDVNALEEIKRTCLCVSFSTGLSSFSFSFRGLKSLRDAMHTIFLQHAIPKGLNLSIINPGGLPRLRTLVISPKTHQLAEEVILNKSEDGNHVERFLENAEQVRKPSAPAPAGPVMKMEKSTAEQQSTFLRSLKDYEAEHVQPKPRCQAVDPCRVDEPQKTQKVAQKIIEGKTPAPTEVSARVLDGQQHHISSPSWRCSTTSRSSMKWTTRQGVQARCKRPGMCAEFRAATAGRELQDRPRQRRGLWAATSAS